MKISTNKFVALSYDLNVGEGEERELMERATAETPLEFIYGTNSMLEAFEKNLDGLAEGDSFNFVLTPEQAYGEYDDEAVVDLPRNIFEQDGVLNEEVIFEGNIVPMMDTNGNRLNGSVVEVKDDIIKMDFNHPLAGETLNFSGKVLSVRESTPEEIAALFAPKGGCGCGSGCGCGDEEGDSCGCGSHDEKEMAGGCGSGCGCGGH
ncbi:FKBP-type peptidyl-prolyl cis-trans isomerase SlyD [Dysgonomonas sp. PFB1-18]|uniref:FKBP-type peptidyl-prolyl cis-trans isomerase n=1 Tax=unclassified Dysgonomonas TaxID=2630389 RepID=UPI00247326AE|nr:MULTISPECIES: FKBP-type peptidyl-prolyl cis-trans isomerase [unclassified Dysgonomonas]MDH6307595.1 FKBP-type peptidyl-prolyl cis-trans isomerase SlyD [Dysgonomonas sp. PF1-14]MDH6337513.1 FKBP-type peptidyl-prolyl cis-trans isomerase SlyD [Dysgonomonas sp. PF1-16]MDH6378738.1 FKBP-type peptidyl-prolyl cis-trans isomerase SlyD [Dysgonomonas sp. PFB1-18]MDH6399156.1 FKBP-type peptidyl-prolyl cis-trans isomerase SlyD [Dysgonomonas sp. PF1-23]